MQRRTIEPRPGWQQTVEEQGLVYPLTRHPDDSLRPYWDESAYYVFSLPEVEALEEIVEELHAMCLAAADAHRRPRPLRRPRHHRPAHRGAWSPSPGSAAPNCPSVYGRFDLRYDGTGPAKLLEYNADTPTSLVEAASPQWFWMEDRFPGADQWNSLHERLDRRLEAAGRPAPARQPPPLRALRRRRDRRGPDDRRLSEGDGGAGGPRHRGISVEEIGWDRLSGRFVDNQLRFIRSCFKLYPWEWLTTDEFADHVLGTLDNGGGTGSTLWIEPAWKMLLSNKALLAVLWELYPDHPNLLPAYLDGPRELAHTTGYVAKPLLGREGAGVTVHEPGSAAPAAHESEEPCCYQELAPLPAFDGNHVVLGAWVVENESAGLGIRESAGLITDEYARFLPHVIL